MLNKDYKAIIYVFIAIIVSVGQSIMLIGNLYSSNKLMSLIVHLSAWLPPLFLFEQLISTNSKKKLILLNICFYFFFVFLTIPENLLENNIRGLAKAVGVVLTSIVITYLLKNEKNA